MKYSFKFLNNKNRMILNRIKNRWMLNNYTKFSYKYREKNKFKDFNQEIKL